MLKVATNLYYRNKGIAAYRSDQRRERSRARSREMCEESGDRDAMPPVRSTAGACPAALPRMTVQSARQEGRAIRTTEPPAMKIAISRSFRRSVPPKFFTRNRADHAYCRRLVGLGTT